MSDAHSSRPDNGGHAEPLPPSQTPLSPTTTAEEDIATHGQRRINLVWESTQAVIAVAVTCAVLAVGVVTVLRGDDSSKAAAWLLLGSAFQLVISTYLTRTNHTKVGGVPSSTVPSDRRGE